MEAQGSRTANNDSAAGMSWAAESSGWWLVVVVVVVYAEDGGRKHELGWLNRCRRRTDHTKGTSEGVSE